MADRLILPSGEDAADETRAVERDRRDRAEAERGTHRNLRLLRSRGSRVTPRSRVKGILGYR